MTTDLTISTESMSGTEVATNLTNFDASGELRNAAPHACITVINNGDFPSITHDAAWTTGTLVVNLCRHRETKMLSIYSATIIEAYVRHCSISRAPDTKGNMSDDDISPDASSVDSESASRKEHTFSGKCCVALLIDKGLDPETPASSQKDSMPSKVLSKEGELRVKLGRRENAVSKAGCE